jgi:hypothetical protein
MIIFINCALSIWATHLSNMRLGCHKLYPLNPWRPPRPCHVVLIVPYGTLLGGSDTIYNDLGKRVSNICAIGKLFFPLMNYHVITISPINYHLYITTSSNYHFIIKTPIPSVKTIKLDG